MQKFIGKDLGSLDVGADTITQKGYHIISSVVILRLAHETHLSHSYGPMTQGHFITKLPYPLNSTVDLFHYRNSAFRNLLFMKG